MTTGEVIMHHGIQIAIRAYDYTVGWTKINAIIDYLDGVSNVAITVDSTDYTMNNASRTSSVIALGPEKGVKRREAFTINLLATITEG